MTVTSTTTHPVARGTEVLITCKFTTAGYTANSKKWLFNGKPFSATQTGQVAADATDGDNTKSVYKITKASKADTGAYTCSADFSGTKKTSDPALTLQVIGKTSSFSF